VTVAVVSDRSLLAAAVGALLRECGFDVHDEGRQRPASTASRRAASDVRVVLTRAETVHQDAEALQRALEHEPGGRVAVVILDDVGACGAPLLSAGCTVVLPATVTASELASAVGAAVSGERLVHADVLAAALGALRGDPGRGGRDLTPRELDVLRLVADGRTNASIGRELGVAASTVKTHVASLLDKLDAHDRAHAVSIALRAGLIR
jgi:DNA-binding NarL/FixJ family response regulator